MKHDEIVDKIIERLRFQDEQGGDFQEEPYKGDSFRLFVEAAQEGDGLRADRLGGMINARAPELLHGKNWALLRAAWPEWDYAWSRANEARDQAPLSMAVCRLQEGRQCGFRPSAVDVSRKTASDSWARQRAWNI